MSARCECGAVSGSACAYDGPSTAMVVVEWMPEYLRPSHEAAGNSGSWPHNGSERLEVSADCADWIVEGEGDWAELVDVTS